MSTKNTQTPWVQKQFGPMVFRILTNDGTKQVAQIGNVDYRTTPEQMRADAEFIVRAVNSHEALLEAIKKLGAVVDWARENVQIPGELQAGAAVLAAAAAVAQANGEVA